jgi:V8-like Glu-specific endopeptidase
MYIPTFFSAALTLSSFFLADAAPEPCKANSQPCKSHPLVKANTFEAPELAKITEKYMPKGEYGRLNATGVLGYKPKKIPLEAQAKIRPIKALTFDKLVSFGLNNTALFLRKEVQNYQGYPWSTIGKVNSYDELGGAIGGCSGTAVGRNLLLTASHCLPWGRGDGKWQMEFIPAFNGEDLVNPRPYGTAWATQCRGVRNTDKVTGLDYVICQLDIPIGDTTGYMGWQASSSNSFYKDGTWTSVGYPGDSHDGNLQMVEDGIKLDDVDDEGSDGKELESYVYSTDGWSGGPLFRLVDSDPRVVGVMSGNEKEFSFWDFFTADHTVSAGGLHMARLIAYGRENWKP